MKGPKGAPSVLLQEPTPPSMTHSTDPSGHAPSVARACIGQSYRMAPAVPRVRTSIPHPSFRACPWCLSVGLLLPAQISDTWGASSSASTPPLLGHNVSVRNLSSSGVKSDPHSWWRWPDVTVSSAALALGGESSSHRITSPPCADGQLGDPAPAPSRGRCRSAKPAAVSKRQNLSQAMRLAIKGSGRRSSPAEAPQEQWQSFWELATEGWTKAHAAPKLQLLPQYKTGGVQIWFLSSKSS